MLSSNIYYVDRYICFEEISMECEADFEACVHWNKPYMNNANTILRFTAGQWNVLVEGSFYTFAPGELCLIKPLEACQVTPINYPCMMQRISFSVYYFHVLDPKQLLDKPFSGHSFGVGNRVTALEYDESLLRRRLAQVIEEVDISSRRLPLCVALVGLLFELYKNYNYTSVDSRPEEIRTIIHYLNAHYCEDVDLETLTKNLYHSRSWLAKTVKKVTGFTTWEYILNKRIFRATQLLHEGISNAEVAKAVGFRDYSTFFKAFRKINYFTPTMEQPDDGHDPWLKNFYDLDFAMNWLSSLNASAPAESSNES